MRAVRGLLLGLLVCAWTTNTEAVEPTVKNLRVKVGDKAPDFALRDQQGNLVRLSDFASCYNRKTSDGKYVLLDFFATDCKACKQRLPQVVAVSKKYADKVQVLLVTLLEKEDGQDKLDDFLSTHPVPFPVLVDAYSSVAKKYVMQGDLVTIPAFFLIDSQGSVRDALVGLEENLEVTVAKVLAPETASP